MTMARVWIELLIPAEPPATLSTFMSTIKVNEILALAQIFHNHQSGDPAYDYWFGDAGDG